MKTERAIELLKRISDSQFDGEYGDERREALEMAVRALFSQQTVNDSQGLVNDCISRNMAIDAMRKLPKWNIMREDYKNVGFSYDDVMFTLEKLTSAQPERDIPVKPIETTDKAWGIPKRQAVCPNCDYYLGHVAFLGDYKGKRVTYCETCGQAIDWEGWNFDE